MIIQVPYEANAQVLMPRKRKPTNVRLAGSCMVEIAEASDAVVVAKLRIGDSHLFEGRPIAAELLHHAGRLWLPIVEGRDAAQAVVPAEALADPERDLQMQVFWQGSRDHYLDSVKIEDVARILSDGRPDVEKAIHRHAANYRIMGGIVHETVREPIYRAGHRDLERTTLAEVDGWGRMDLFRGDRFDEALETWLANADDPPSPRRLEVMKSERMEVLRPDLLAFDDISVALRETARSLVTATGKYLESASKATLCDYADLRDALAALGEKDDARSLGHLCYVLLMRMPDLMGRVRTDELAVIKRWWKREGGPGASGVPMSREDLAELELSMKDVG